mmetsp:Transcript_49308/g.107334  ORF Transcript_49308/g.107334 Transcript_49308/m.107334 type:complete len:119 (+) Transcript_49308:263-619(+)
MRRRLNMCGRPTASRHLIGHSGIVCQSKREKKRKLEGFFTREAARAAVKLLACSIPDEDVMSQVLGHQSCVRPQTAHLPSRSSERAQPMRTTDEQTKRPQDTLPAHRRCALSMSDGQA